MISVATLSIKCLVNLCVGVIATTTLYWACFLYPDEEGKLQNKVEQFWVAVDERRRLNQSVALAAKVAALINSVLNRILGPRLLSIRMLAVTSCCSILGLKLWEIGLLAHSANAAVRAPLLFDPYFLWEMFGDRLGVTAALVAVILIASKHPKAWATIAAIAVAGYSLACDQLPFIPAYRGESSLIDLTLTAVFILSLASDVVFVAALRWTIRWLIRDPSTRSFLTGVCLQFAIIGALVALPLHFGHAHDLITPQQRGVELGFNISNTFILFGLNTSTGIFAVSFLAVLLFMLIHKLVWPVAARVIHPIARFKLIRNRKLLIAISITCFAFIFPPFAELLRKARDMFK